MKRPYLFLIGILTIVSLCALANGSQTSSDTTKLIEDLHKGEAQAKAAWEQFQKERTETMNRLHSFVNENIAEEKEKLIVLEVVKIIGWLRSPNSIDILKSNMLFEPYEEQTRPTPPDVWYPCVGALIKIGDPVIPHMIDILVTEKNDDKKRYLARWVIESVLGGGKNTSWNDRKGKVLTKALLEEEVRIRTDESQKQLLQKVIMELEKAIREIK